jgi:hypothetical protein
LVDCRELIAQEEIIRLKDAGLYAAADDPVSKRTVEAIRKFPSILRKILVDCREQRSQGCTGPAIPYRRVGGRVEPEGLKFFYSIVKLHNFRHF